MPNKLIPRITNQVANLIVKLPFSAPQSFFKIYELGQYRKFLQQSGIKKYPQLEHRNALYESVHKSHLAGAPVDYLEFGVFEGESIKKWSGLNAHPDSRFFGFDSFEGLPTDWEGLPKGHFETKGEPPKINDPRVKFIKGWFNDTLPAFLQTFSLKNRLIIHYDADLYSSTLYVMATLHNMVQPGTIIIFDEFDSVLHEFRAFKDYNMSFNRSWTPCGWSRCCERHQMAFIAK